MGGKQPRISLGTYPAVSLQQARERAAEYRALVANGIDPAKSGETRNIATRWSKTTRSRLPPNTGTNI